MYVYKCICIYLYVFTYLFNMNESQNNIEWEKKQIVCCSITIT